MGFMLSMILHICLLKHSDRIVRPLYTHKDICKVHESPPRPTATPPQQGGD